MQVLEKLDLQLLYGFHLFRGSIVGNLDVSWDSSFDDEIDIVGKLVQGFLAEEFLAFPGT